jgi:hypothetical protein
MDLLARFPQVLAIYAGGGLLKYLWPRLVDADMERLTIRFPRNVAGNPNHPKSKNQINIFEKKAAKCYCNSLAIRYHSPPHEVKN